MNDKEVKKIKNKNKNKLNLIANILLVVGLILLAVPTGLWLNATYSQWSLAKKWKPVVASYSDDSIRTLRYSQSNQGANANDSQGMMNEGVTPTASNDITGWSADLVDTGTIKPGENIAYIEIPKLDFELSVIEGENWANLAKGPVHVSDTARIGNKGTSLISGHRTMYAAPFHDLQQLELGDKIILYTDKALFIYTVDGIKKVHPDDWSDIKPEGDPRLVLSTCEPMFSAEKRLLIISKLTTASRLRTGTQ